MKYIRKSSPWEKHNFPSPHPPPNATRQTATGDGPQAAGSPINQKVNARGQPPGK